MTPFFHSIIGQPRIMRACIGSTPRLVGRIVKRRRAITQIHTDNQLNRLSPILTCVWQDLVRVIDWKILLWGTSRTSPDCVDVRLMNGAFLKRQSAILHCIWIAQT